MKQYGQSWKDVIELVRSGSSWSGRERNCVYLNTGGATASMQGRFTNVSSISGIDFPDDARGMSIVDWDRDGDLDIWVRNRTAPRLRFLRNDAVGDDRRPSVLVRLRGTKCNRDAVGASARYIGAATEHPLVRTVTAGNGFVSQSSKWLHFGLGNNSKLGKESAGTIEVRWPGGKVETFAGIAAGGRYLLTQGSGEAQRVTTPAVPITAGQVLSLPADTAVARIVLPARMPLPLVDWRNDQGEPTEVAIQSSGKPTLVLLWTSSCPNCCDEVSRFAAAQQQIEARGLNIVGLNIDNLQAGFTSTGFDVTALSQPTLRLQTTEASLSRIVNLQKALFDKYPPFVVPLSFLLDRDANIIVMYRGAVGLDTIFRDMELVSRSNSQLRDLAAPFDGSWFTTPATDSEFIEFAAKKLYSRDRSQGLRYFRLAMDAAPDGQRKSHLRGQIVSTYLKLSRSSAAVGDMKQAESYLWEALGLANDREKPVIHHELGVFFGTAGDYDSAETHFREALQLRPDYPTAKRNLDLLRRKRSEEK